jgi:hypothetical protein
VHDGEALRVVQAIGDLRRQIDYRFDRQALRFAQDMLQRATLDQLHGDVGDVVLLADVVNGDHIRMVQAPGALRLAQEALSHLVHDLFRKARIECLDGDFALDERILRAIHDAHGTAP